MNKTTNINATHIDTLESGELVSSLSIMMGVSFDYTTSLEGAVKFKDYTILKEYESELTKSVVDTIENPYHPFLDVWYESEECFIATVASMIAERNERIKLGRENDILEEIVLEKLLEKGEKGVTVLDFPDHLGITEDSLEKIIAILGGSLLN